MKPSSPTHVLTLLLAAAAATAASATEFTGAGGFGGSGVGDAPAHERLSASANGGSFMAHELLKTNVVSGVGGDLEGLSHPLHQYMVGFVAWAYKYGKSWSNAEEALHALQARICRRAYRGRGG